MTLSYYHSRLQLRIWETDSFIDVFVFSFLHNHLTCSVNEWNTDWRTGINRAPVLGSGQLSGSEGTQGLWTLMWRLWGFSEHFQQLCWQQRPSVPHPEQSCQPPALSGAGWTQWPSRDRQKPGPEGNSATLSHWIEEPDCYLMMRWNTWVQVQSYCWRTLKAIVQIF